MGRHMKVGRAHPPCESTDVCTLFEGPDCRSDGTRAPLQRLRELRLAARLRRRAIRASHRFHGRTAIPDQLLLPAPVDPKVTRGIICAAFAERQLTSQGGSSNILRRASVLAVTRLSHVDPLSLEVCDLADAAFISPGKPPECCLEAAAGSSGLADCSRAGSEDCAFALPAASPTACADDACCLLAASAWKVPRLPACHSATELLVGEPPGLSLARCAIMASASIWLARRTKSVADMSLLPLGSARGTSGMVVPPDMDVCRLGALLELRLPFMARSGSLCEAQSDHAAAC